MDIPEQITPEEGTTVQFNNSEYVYDVIMMNSQYGYRIPNGIITDLVIVDNIYSIFHSGYITINNKYNLLENHYQLTNKQYESEKNNISYVYDNNGRDLIIVKIKPKLPDIKKEEDDFLKDKDWGLNFVFVIYDEDEIHDVNKQNEKLKIFKLRDIREQVLDEAKFNWSSTSVLQNNYNNVRYQQLKTEVPTGLCIQDIIKKSLVGFTNTFGDWDNGGTKIFYSNHNNGTALDCIEYVFDRHIGAENYDNCLLRYERDQKWTLIPLEKYFSKAIKKKEKLPNEYTIDLLTLHDVTSDDKMQGNEIKVPNVNKMSYNLLFDIQEFPGLTNFSFVNPTTLDSINEIVTTQVHSHNHKEKQFNIDSKKNAIESVQKDFQDLYVSKMYGENPINLIPVNKRKKENEIVNACFSNYQTETNRYKEGRNKILSKSIAFSPSISFTTLGVSVRKAGRFITIAAVNNNPDIAFQNILQGEWFITKIIHKFTGNYYINNITAVKPYAYKDIKS